MVDFDGYGGYNWLGVVEGFYYFGKVFVDFDFWVFK